jgi:hypothetical protein
MPALSSSAPGKVILFGEPRKAKEGSAFRSCEEPSEAKRRGNQLSAVARRLKADEANPNMVS